MSKHTPGPWSIANGSPPQVIAPGKCDICAMSGAASNESVMADARLIAAAPDLLEALQALVARHFTYHGGFVVDCNISEEEVERARAAIQRATGEA